MSDDNCCNVELTLSESPIISLDALGDSYIGELPTMSTVQKGCAKVGAGLQMTGDVLSLSDGDIGSAVDDWLDAHPEATTTVQDGSITDAKLVQTGGVLSLATDTAESLGYERVRSSESYPFTNLLDKDSANRREGIYVVYSSGRPSSNNDYFTYVIPVIAGRKISGYMLKYAHICFFSDCPDITNAVGGSGVQVGAFISGFTPGGTGAFDGTDVPNNAKYLTVSCNKAANELNYSVIQYSDANEGNDGYTRDAFDIAKSLEWKASLATGKNILDLESNAKSGIYVNGTSGAIGNNSTYATAVIRVNPGDVLSFNSDCSNAHVSFVSAWQNASAFTSGTTVIGYISGFANDAKQNFTVPAGAVAMIFSYAIARKNQVQVEKATASTSYEPYWKGVPFSEIHGILPVGAGMKYETISDAVAVASSTDIILVYPGVYNEAVEAWGKYVNIIGMSRDKCVLTYGGGDYQTPPLEMSHGVLANMTIRTTYEETTGTAPAYCLHVEDSTAAGSSFHIKNVTFINDKHQTVGIGLRNNYTIEFENCSFINTVGANALYCHDYETVTTGLTAQRINLINCSFRTSSATNTTIKLQSQEIENNRATALFQRCIVKNAGGGGEISMVKWQGRDQGGGNFLDSTDWLLDDMSALNTLATINA